MNPKCVVAVASLPSAAAWPLLGSANEGEARLSKGGLFYFLNSETQVIQHSLKDDYYTEGCYLSQSTAATTMGQMTEYEHKRLENVQRNQQMLAALRVHDTTEGLRSASKKPKLETKGFKLPKRGKGPEPSVLQRSLWTRGISPESIGDLGSDSPPAKPHKQLIVSSPAFLKLLRSARNGPLSLAETYVPFQEEASYDHYFNLLRQLRDHAPLADLIRAKTNRGPEGGALVGPKFSPGDLTLEAKGIARLAPNRIFSVHILPCRERLIVASGDKEGHLSLWDADSEEEGNGLRMYLPHSSPVSGIATAPFSMEKEERALQSSSPLSSEICKGWSRVA